MNAPYFNFAPLAGGNRLSGIRQVFSSATQDAAKREHVVAVSLPTIGGVNYHYLSGSLVKDGVIQPGRES